MKKTVVLLSGGIDSSTTIAIAAKKHFEIYALTINYGQKHKIEIVSAKKIAKRSGVKEHLIIDLNLRLIGGSALTANNIQIPKNSKFKIQNSKFKNTSIPPTYVPARNLIFLALAASWAEVSGARNIFIGVNSIDFSGYPDCREDFLKSAEETINYGTKAGREGKRIKINAPLINMSKSEIIKKGIELGVDFRLTHSCYEPSSDGKSCGVCDSCLIRLKGFKEAGIKDPVKYNI